MALATGRPKTVVGHDLWMMSGNGKAPSGTNVDRTPEPLFVTRVLGFAMYRGLSSECKTSKTRLPSKLTDLKATSNAESWRPNYHLKVVLTALMKVNQDPFCLAFSYTGQLSWGVPSIASFLNLTAINVILRAIK
jgi:hypothetical protein